MSDLTFEERNRLESEVLPAVVDDPEWAALTIVILEKQLAEARAERDAVHGGLHREHAPQTVARVVLGWGPSA